MTGLWRSSHVRRVTMVVVAVTPCSSRDDSCLSWHKTCPSPGQRTHRT